MRFTLLVLLLCICDSGPTWAQPKTVTSDGGTTVSSAPDLDEPSASAPGELEPAAPSEGGVEGSRLLQWITMGSGAVLASVGATLFMVSESDEAALRDTERDSQGRIRSITQREAARQEQDINERRSLSVGLMLTGAALVTAGFTWWLLDGPKAVSVPMEAPRQENHIPPFGWLPDVMVLPSAQGTTVFAGWSGAF